MLEEIVKEYVAELEKEKEALLKKKLDLIEVNKNVQKNNGLIHSIVGRIKKVNDKFNDDVENLKNDQIDKVKKIDDLIKKMQNIDYVVSLLYKERPELFKNPTFMIELVKKDIKYIIYDMTDDDNVYRIFASKVIESSGNDNITSEKFSRLIGELDTPKVPETGKYKIPHRFLFEAIRKAFLMARKENDDRIQISFEPYFDNDCRYSYEFGKRMEELYLNPNIDLYTAGIGDFDGAFREGYEINYSGNLSRNLWSPHSIDNSFMSLFADGGYGREHLIFAAVPKSDTEILGSDGEVGRYDITEKNWYAYKTYLLPKYIIGVSKHENGEAMFIENPLLEEQKKQYKNTGRAFDNYVYFDEVIDEIDRSLISDGSKNDVKPDTKVEIFDDEGQFIEERNIDINEELKTGKRR